MAVHGVVLSGGNDLAAFGGNAPERDATESVLLREAEERGLPVIGICRGFQFLAHHAGGKVVAIDGHVRSRHDIRGSVNREVNSFHNWGVSRCGEGWETYAMATDGTIEFAGCPARRQWGIMWHPEREPAFVGDDLDLFRRLLGETAANREHRA
jgi:putative glutamine amidotransferase